MIHAYLALGLLLPPAPQVAPPATELRGGLWYDGEGFEPETLWAVDGLLTRERPPAVERVLDLEGGYVVPPFGEAHNHNVHAGADATLARYLREGIFYVKNPNSLPDRTEPLREYLARPDTLDAVFAAGGLTAPGGHPVELFERNVASGIWTEADGEGQFFHTLAGPADVARKWEALLAGRPDFVKTYLLYSEEYEARREDEASFGWRGLDPALLPDIVRRAHALGLPIATHVETAADFRQAVAAGVDEVNHMPGFRVLPGHDLGTYRIRDEDARLAGERGLIVVTTLGETLDELARRGLDDPARAAFLDLQHANLAVLAEHGVGVALGSDAYGGTSLGEATSLHRDGLLDEAALLEAWCVTTARTIFPERRIGRLEEGYEASFLVLEDDPLVDFAAVRRIRLRVKQGFLLEP